MFITFEGIDGCGKSTQLKLLSKYFISQGKEVLCLREPGGLPLSEDIRSILLNSEEHINPITELLLFEASRSHLVEHIIEPSLKAGKIILCDRYFDSTTAYQGYGRGIDLDLIHKLNDIATMGRIPDITILLDVDYDEAMKRSKKRTHDRIETSGKEFYLKLIDGFRELADKSPERFIKIYSDEEIPIIHNRIVDAINIKMQLK